MKNRSAAVSFGLNEVVLTLLCAFSGFFDKTRNEIIYVIAITAVASSIPDVYAFYQEAQNEDKLSRGQAARQTGPVFIAEIMGAIALGVPLVVFRDRLTRTVMTFATGLGVILVNEIWIQQNNLSKIVETMLFAIFAIVISYILSGLIKKIFTVL